MRGGHTRAFTPVFDGLWAAPHMGPFVKRDPVGWVSRVPHIMSVDLDL